MKGFLWSRESDPELFGGYMRERDTFYWHQIGWPPGGVTAPVRRCKEEVSS
jgi:hypothetical protein